MGDIIRLVSKSELERARLIREARAIYDSIFPSNDAVGAQPDSRVSQEMQAERQAHSFDKKRRDDRNE